MKSEVKRQVLDLFEQGFWIDEIAVELGVSVELVKGYLSAEKISFRAIPVDPKWREMFAHRWDIACNRLRKDRRWSR